MSEPSIALYIGESYASLAVFDLQNPQKPKNLFEKLVFLPQISLKTLLQQTKQALPDLFADSEIKNIFVVTRYFDRLKNFRLGGSVAQVVLEGFENSYATTNTKALSLAASQLMISIPRNKVATLDIAYLELELERLRKINPETNKIVIQLPEEQFSSSQKELVITFFENNGFKVFDCINPYNLGQIRRTLLNAGSEGTKEEILTDLRELGSENTNISFWIKNNFQSEFENVDLYKSADDFIAYQAQIQKFNEVAYFDHETFRVISAQFEPIWNSPWGKIPLEHSSFKELSPHPFAEVRLNHLSLLEAAPTHTVQYEPGPVLAGRGVKPLVLDFFHAALSNNRFMQSLFPQMNSDSQKTKLNNHFSVLEKGQLENSFTHTKEELLKLTLENLLNDLTLIAKNKSILLTGPLQELIPNNIQTRNHLRVKSFSWPEQIIATAIQKGL